MIATVRRAPDEALVRAAGADEVVLTGAGKIAERIRAFAPKGVDHIVEVAFAANIEMDKDVLTPGGSIAAYATNDPAPPLPFWELLFKNARIFLIGSDDFSDGVKLAATRTLNAALEAGWTGYEIAERLPLSEIARAHELVEQPEKRGRVVVTL